MHAQGIEHLYQLHASAIEAHCSRLLGHPADATDALHETFIRALSAQRDPSSDDHAVRSLFRISTNVCIDVLRQRDVRGRAVLELSARARARQASEGSDYDSREWIEVLLRRCDDTTRSILAMRVVEGKKRTEIAATLGTSRRTILNRLKRLERLASELRDEE